MAPFRKAKLQRRTAATGKGPFRVASELQPASVQADADSSPADPRWDRIVEIREALRNGTYDEESRLDVLLGRLMPNQAARDDDTEAEAEGDE